MQRLVRCHWSAWRRTIPGPIAGTHVAANAVHGCLARSIIALTFAHSVCVCVCVCVCVFVFVFLNPSTGPRGHQCNTRGLTIQSS